MDVIEVAAWAIIGQLAGKYIYRVQREKRERIERLAESAEYTQIVNEEYTIDDSQPKWKRERLRERRQQLLMRYPHILVPSPEMEYFGQASKQDRQNHPPFTARLKSEWKWWLLSIVAVLIGYTLSTSVKTLLKSFFG